jgi:DNA-directed RNA polymerase delta subunit
MDILVYKPKQTAKKLLSALKERSRDIISQRYGLNAGGQRKTLEAIGEGYGVTRERIRQIENYSLDSIRKHDIFTDAEEIFSSLREEIEKRGGLVHENRFLESLSPDPYTQNCIHFFLVLVPYFEKIKEDDIFHHRWTADAAKAESIHSALENLHKEISEEDVLSGKEIISLLKKQAKEAGLSGLSENEFYEWLAVSKLIDRNALDEWGLRTATHIKPRGVKDLAFLVLKRHGSPMHFTEVAEVISNTFGKKAHPQTTHNELIKDDRFVLVGRGLYGLKDWGYSQGTVRDVLKSILKNSSPLTKDEITKKVLKERYVKENTILVNLQDKKYFKKDSQGRYIVV